MAALSTNSAHWTADTTHVGLLDDATGSTNSVRAITAVITASPHPTTRSPESETPMDQPTRGHRPGDPDPATMRAIVQDRYGPSTC